MIRVIAMVGMLIFGLFSCKQAKPTTKLDIPDINSVELIKTPCRGQCPVLTFEMDNSFHVHYEGKKHTDPIGFFEGDFSEDKWNELVSALHKMDYRNKAENQYSGATDLSASYWTITDELGTKKIAYDKKMDKDLAALEDVVMEWITSYKWSNR